MTVNELIEKAHKNALNKGFWEDVEDLPPEFLEMMISQKLALIHEEVSEALGELRNGAYIQGILANGPSAKPEGFPIELADVVIRIADLCGFLRIDLERAIGVKMAYNSTRPHKHGRAF